MSACKFSLLLHLRALCATSLKRISFMEFNSSCMYSASDIVVDAVDLDVIVCSCVRCCLSRSWILCFIIEYDMDDSTVLRSRRLNCRYGFCCHTFVVRQCHSFLFCVLSREGDDSPFPWVDKFRLSFAHNFVFCHRVLFDWVGHVSSVSTASDNFFHCIMCCMWAFRRSRTLSCCWVPNAL